MPSDLSSLPNYPTPDPPQAGRDEGLRSAERSDEPLRQSSTLVLYGLALRWIGVFGLPLVVFSFQGGPVAVVGAILLLGSEVWLFTQIFAGNPAVALVVLLIPVLGPCWRSSSSSIIGRLRAGPYYAN